MSTSVLAAFSAVVIVAMTAAGVWAFSAAPEIPRIAVHWNFAGEAVAFRTKEFALALPPALAAALSIVMWFLSARLGGHSAKQHRAVWLAGLLALALVHAFFVLAAAGIVTTFGNYTALGPAVFAGVMGNYWAKRSTNRWPGRVLVATCFATFATWILLPGAAAELVLIAGALVAMLTGAVAKRESNDATLNNGT